LEFSDKVIVVTGGAGGIGAALCRRVAREGPEAIVVADLHGDAAAEVARDVGGHALTSDLSTEGGVNALIDEVLDRHGRIDVYCSNAGVAVGGGADVEEAGWQLSWDVNVMAGVRAARRLVPGWLERGAGAFISTVSAAGLLNHIFAAPYGTTKAAALSFAEWLSIAYGDQGIHVSAVCPQGVRTAMLDDDPTGFLLTDAIPPEQVADDIVDGVRAGRFLILPHPEVAEYAARRGGDHDRWIRGMRRLRAAGLQAAEAHGVELP
jgi:NAD(P)-dependent dehydrogenase (short-subunit alcohol dehydrogenase family)